MKNLRVKSLKVEKSEEQAFKKSKINIIFFQRVG